MIFFQATTKQNLIQAGGPSKRSTSLQNKKGKIEVIEDEGSETPKAAQPA